MSKFLTFQFLHHVCATFPLTGVNITPFFGLAKFLTKKKLTPQVEREPLTTVYKNVLFFYIRLLYVVLAMFAIQVIALFVVFVAVCVGD